MSVNNDYVHFVSKKEYSKIKTVVTTLDTLVISQHFYLRNLILSGRFAQAQNVIVGVM